METILYGSTAIMCSKHRLLFSKQVLFLASNLWILYIAKGCIGTVCPCFLFGKNAEFLGSGTLAGSCMTHFILFGLLNFFCCLSTGGILSGFPGAMVACYACGYRKALRTKYNLEEAPCGDLTTHIFCHLCANCQEYREIRERSAGSTPVLKFPTVTAPSVQTMELDTQD